MKKSLFLAFAAAIQSTAAAQYYAIPENVRYDSGSGHFYEIVYEGGTTWVYAVIYSQERFLNQLSTVRGRLATVESEHENRFLTDSFGNDLDGKWIGGLQPTGSPEPAGGWIWNTGTPITFLGWFPGEPNNSGGNENRTIYGHPIQPWGKPWNDAPADTPASGYVVEYEFGSEPDPGSLLQDPLSGRYYEIVYLPVTWEQARDLANQRSYFGTRGHLVTINSVQESLFLYNNWGPFLDQKWLGGFQPAGSPEPGGGWTWVTGEPMTFTGWISGEPNNGFPGEDAMIFMFAAQPWGKPWNDAPSSGFLGTGFVIEYPVLHAPFGVSASGFSETMVSLDGKPFVSETVFADIFLDSGGGGTSGGIPDTAIYSVISAYGGTYSGFGDFMNFGVWVYLSGSAYFDHGSCDGGGPCYSGHVRSEINVFIHPLVIDAGDPVRVSGSPGARLRSGNTSTDLPAWVSPGTYYTEFPQTTFGVAASDEQPSTPLTNFGIGLYVTGAFPCPGDASWDNAVNFSDITSVLTNWSATYARADVAHGDANHDRVVNFADLTAVLTNWAVSCPN